MNQKPPPNYWNLILSVGSLAVAAIALISGTTKADRDDTRTNERRICRLEALSGIGECKR